MWELKKVTEAELPDALNDKWIIHKNLKTGVKIQRLRPPDERLENTWWILLYRMGYLELNQGRSFKISMRRRDGIKGVKQIDVFARDGETVVISECKSSDRLRSRSLQKDIEEFGSIKGDIASTVKKYYGPDFKPKILWFFITQNIIWSDEDIARARANRIQRVTELDLPYYTQLVEHLGKAARFQFLAEFLKDQSIPELEGLKVPATRGRLGGQYFYSFVTTPRHLLKIAFVNHRTLDDPEGHPTYQRLIQKTRLRDIGKYISEGGFFPNNLLVNFAKSPRFDILQKDIPSDSHYGHLYLPTTYKSAWIIDGQHRLYGYANLDDSHLDSPIVVVAFEGLNKTTEANMFVTINHEQKPVPKTLLDDLEGQLKWESDDPSERIGALAARLIQQMNRDLSSPLYNRFTAEGIKGTEKTSLTVPQVKSGLRRSGLLGRAVVKGVYEAGPLCGKTDNATVMRAQKILNGYFRLIENADGERWDKGRPGLICTNEGIQAHLILIAELLKYMHKGDNARSMRLSEKELLGDLAPFLDPVLDFIASGGAAVQTEFVVPFGSGGPREYFFRLARLLRKTSPDFEPGDYLGWELAQSDDLRREADERIQSIQSSVLRHIFKVFRVLFGEEKNLYWERGVKNKEIQLNAYKKSLDYVADERLPLEAYLDFIELKKIVETKDNWKLFKAVFDIAPPGVKGQAKNLDWMERINELRRISAHRSEGRNYKPEDFGEIARIYEELARRLGAFDYDSIADVSEQAPA
jgi:DGQHR domain-containing protein